MINFTTSLGKLKLSFPVMNASGILGATESEITRVLESESGAAVIKSVTLDRRLGNEGIRYYMEDFGSINSMGLPNQGIKYYCNLAKKLSFFKKPIILSVAGFSENDYLKIVTYADNYPFSAFEINLSCPNIEGKGIFAYDFKTSFSILEKLRKLTKKTLGVKLPPFVQRTEISEYSEFLISNKIDFISSINTFPLSCYIDWRSEKMRIKPNMGIGGLGGKSVKQIALAQIVLFREFTKNKLSIIGVGGISSASDIYEFILTGASAVQIGTELIRKGPELFQELKTDLIKILEEKGIKKLSDKVGKLKYL